MAVQGAIAMLHEKDPRDVITEQLGKRLDDATVLGPTVLVANYVRPEKTAGGLFIPDKVRDEDNFQGKVGMVIKLGPLAFQDDGEHRFGEQVPQVGDWIVFNPANSWPFKLGDVTVRFIEDIRVSMIISKPDVVF